MNILRKKDIEAEIQEVKKKISVIENQIKTKKQEIAEQQKYTIDIEGVLNNINELGIDSFKIDKENNSIINIKSLEQKSFKRMNKKNV
jgi:uncharacterized protein YdhG (YjbR/CyaY superfamily)